MEYYVYAHLNPDTNQCFYIGKGKGNRVKDGNTGRSTRWNQYTDHCGGFKWKILVNGLSKRKALEIESSFIKQIGIDNLVNEINTGIYRLDTGDEVFEGSVGTITELSGLPRSSVKRILYGKLPDNSKYNNYKVTKL